MATTYCEPSDVQRVLQITAFSGSTTPTDTQVEQFINVAEDQFDHLTQHAWRAVTVTDEFYDLPNNKHRTHFGGIGPGIRIKLRHRKIRSFVSGTDKIEIWNGSSYEEWIATKTEGRADDFWIDAEAGVLYIRLWFPWFNEKGLRMTYRYGDTVIPADVREAIALMASIQVLQSDDRSSVVTETGDATRLNYDARIGQWKSRVANIVKNRAEWNLV